MHRRSGGRPASVVATVVMTWPDMPKRLELRMKIERVLDRWDDLAEQRGWPDRFWVPEVGALNRIFSGLCVVVGHVPTDDHCGRPDHRYCVVCRTSTANASVAYR